MRDYRGERRKKLFGTDKPWKVVKEGVSFRIIAEEISKSPIADEIENLKRNYPNRRVVKAEGDGVC